MVLIILSMSIFCDVSAQSSDDRIGKRSSISYVLYAEHEVSSIRIKNDLDVQKAGIFGFFIEFYGNANRGEFLGNTSFLPISRAKSGGFPTISGVKRIDLVVLSALPMSFGDQIQIQDLKITGNELSFHISTLNKALLLPNGSLQEENKELTLENTKLRSELQTNSSRIASLETDNGALRSQNNNLTLQLVNSSSLISNLEVDQEVLTSENSILNSQLDASSSKIDLWRMLAIGFGLLTVGLMGQIFVSRLFVKPLDLSRSAGESRVWSRQNPPKKKKIERGGNTSVIFSSSVMAAANVATPLSATGHLTASNLQMLKGRYAVLAEMYKAVGRIGFQQIGKPTVEDFSLGTGFLITDRHILTNRHVAGMYGHYLMGEECGGIEFIAEKDKDASYFIPFNGEAPILIPGLDLAIYTLSHSAADRKPIPRVMIPNDDLDGREVVVIGYPDTHNLDDLELLSVAEEKPIFAVKRISRGHIFRHSTDDDDIYGVEVNMSEDRHRSFKMPAICHNASTMGGNSGSPILDINTGDLLGVHFAGSKMFNDEEAANLAMAIAQFKDKTDNALIV